MASMSRRHWNGAEPQGKQNPGGPAAEGAGAAGDAPALTALAALAATYAAERRWHEAQSAMRLTLRRFYDAHRAGQATAEDFAGVVRMLAALGEDDRLYRLYQRCVRGTPGVWDETTLTHMGIAAFNIGRYVEARWLWRAALRRDGQLADVLEALLFTVAAVETGLVPALTLDHRLGPHDLTPDAASAGDDEDVPAFVKALAIRGLWDEDDATREAALDVLAQLDGAWTADFLFGIVMQPDLPDPVKLKAAAWLLERGFVDEDEPVAVHLEGRLQQVCIERGDEPTADAADPEALFHLAVLWAQDDKLNEARAIISGLNAHDLPAAMRPAYYALAGETEDPSGLFGQQGRRLPLVHPTWSLEQALSALTVAQLRAMARRFGVARWSKRRKGDLVTSVATRMRDGLPEWWRELGERERAVLHWLEEHGAVASLEQLRARLSGPAVPREQAERCEHNQADESVGPAAPLRGGVAAPNGWDVVVSLQAKGFLFVGRLEATDEPAAVLLNETRRLLADVWPTP